MKDKMQLSRFMYILEAAFEYLISILVATTFLATLTSELGMSDSLTGILSSIISLGCLFQLLAMFYTRKRQKSFVITFSIINQFLFMFLYVIPLFGFAKNIKIVLFVVVIIAAYFFYNIAHPIKINWLMSLVDDSKRGSFTATKEIVSLIVGIIFNFAMGAVIDHFRDTDNIRTAFVICGVTIFVLMVLHTLTMFFSVEKDISEKSEKTKLKDSILTVLKDKNVIKVAVLFIIWNMSVYISIPFYGTYQIKELGFSLKFVSVVNMVHAVARVSFSGVLGKYADKHSFASMIKICFSVAAIGFFINIFTVPQNGKVFYTLYYICYAIALAGINSSLTNLVFDYVTPEKRTSSLAICMAGGGLTGFLATLIGSGLVSYIQAMNNSLFGITVYAQQVVSFLAFALTIGCVVYVKHFLANDKKEKEKELCLTEK